MKIEEKKKIERKEKKAQKSGMTGRETEEQERGGRGRGRREEECFQRAVTGRGGKIRKKEEPRARVEQEGRVWVGQRRTERDRETERHRDRERLELGTKQWIVEAVEAVEGGGG